MAEQEECEHLTSVDEITVESAAVCVNCVKLGGRWVHLRTCQTCRVTHCCDSSPGKHATAHWKATGHPVVASAESGERWLWCYDDQLAVGY